MRKRNEPGHTQPSTESGSVELPAMMQGKEDFQKNRSQNKSKKMVYRATTNTPESTGASPDAVTLPDVPRSKSKKPLHPPSSPGMSGEHSSVSPKRVHQQRSFGKSSKRRALKEYQKEINYLKLRRSQKQRQVIYQRLKVFLQVCFALAMVGIMVWVGQADFWKVSLQRTHIEGASLLPLKEVQTTLKAYDHKPIYAINPQTIEKHLKEHHEILEDVVVRRYLFPARLEIHVVESQPWAEVYNYLGQAKPHSLITQRYQVVSLKSYHRPTQYFKTAPPVKLVIHQSYLNTKRAQATHLHHLDQIAYRLSQMHGLHFEWLVYQPEAHPNKIKHASTELVAYFDGVKVLLGRLDGSTLERLDRLPPMIKKINELKGVLNYVDLRWDTQILLKLTKPAPEIFKNKSDKLNQDQLL